jgi:hypothetical protein
VTPHNFFQLLLPLIATSKIVSERRIVLADWGHKRDSKINVAGWV